MDGLDAKGFVYFCSQFIQNKTETMNFFFTMVALQAIPTFEMFASSRMERYVDEFLHDGFLLGKRVLLALFVFIIGRLLISIINKVVDKLLQSRKVEASVQGFLCSFVNIGLSILLIVSIVGTLGIETSTLAALLASAGVAIGMALSGNLQNFAGGLVILFFKPYKVGDVIESGGVIGSVHEIQVFHTILHTFDNKVIFIPNGELNSGVVTNYSYQKTRRIDLTYGVSYGVDYNYVKKVLDEIVSADKRILQVPDPFIFLNELGSSSVNIMVRIWVNSEDYWSVMFDMNQTVYARFNAEGITFPFPQLTVHQA